MRIQPHYTINVLTAWNPHRAGTNNHRRWQCLREGMTVAELRTALALTGVPNSEGYIVYALQRNIITIPAAAPAAPRTSTRYIAPVATELSSDLSTDTFGVEIECILPRGMSHAEAARRVTEASGVAVEAVSYGHAVPVGKWKVVTDGSLMGYADYYRGAEFVSPPLRGEEGLRQVNAVCRALAPFAKIRKSCGLHVHVGVGYAPVGLFRRLVEFYRTHECTLDRTQPASRRGSANHFCGPVTLSHSLNTDATREDIITALSGREPRGYRRYKKLNFASWWSYKTVEFRHHAGTVEADKAINWIKFCLRVMLWARSSAPVPTVGDLTSLLTSVGCEASEVTYFNRRADHFDRLLTLGRAA